MTIGSRLFDGAGDHLDVASALGLTYPFAFSVWEKRNVVGNRRLIQVGVAGTDQNYDALTLSSAGAALAISATTTATSAATTTVIPSTAPTIDLSWHHHLAVWYSAGSRAVWTDGAGKGVSINSRAPAGRNALRIGGSFVGSGEWNGYIALPAIWAGENAGLDDAEAMVLASGALPTAVRPGSLLEWWDFDPAGGLIGKILGTVLVATNTTTSTDVPPILNSSAPAIQAVTFLTSAVGGRRRTGGQTQTDTTAPTPAPVLATPTSSGISATVVDLSWTESFDAQSGLAGYVIERSSVSASSGFEVITTVLPGFLTYKDTGLAPNTDYWWRIKAPDKAAVPNVATSNVVTAKTLQSAGGLTPWQIWYYTGSYPLSTDQQYSTPAQTAALARRYLNIISMYPFWERSKTVKAPQMVQNIKAQSTIGSLVVPYMLWQSIQSVHANNGSANKEAWDYFAANGGFAYLNGITEASPVNDSVAGYVQLNHTNAARKTNGLVPRDWFIEWTFSWLRDGATVSNGLSTYTHLPNPHYDGLFPDNVFWANRNPDTDLDRDGVLDNVTGSPASWDLVQRGHASGADKIRAMAPNYRVFCNSADWHEGVERTGKPFSQVAPSLDQKFDGGLIELCFGKATSYEYRKNAKKALDVIKTQIDGYRGEKLALMEVELPTWSRSGSVVTFNDYQAMRYSLCVALITGTRIYHHGPGYRSDDLPYLNFDEYFYPLGRPIGPASFTPWAQGGSNGEGILKREFEFGEVYATMRRGNGPKNTITQTGYNAEPFGGGKTLYPLNAALYMNQDPIVNSGGPGITSLPAMPAGDGRVYARVHQ